MLGSVSEAEDALQEAWIRIRDEDPQAIANMQAWLTTVVGRVCLNLLRSRRTRREALTDFHVPDPVVTLSDGADPEQEALLADSVGLALLVVLDRLGPAERLAFVLHDVFGVPFADIATVLERSEAAAQQLASRARRRLRGAPEPDRDLVRQRQVVDAFLAASRDGDFDALMAVLAPDVVLRVDRGALATSREVRGAAAVADQARTFARLARSARPVLVNGTAGFIVTSPGRPIAVAGFAIADGRIVQIDLLADPARLRRLDLTALES